MHHGYIQVIGFPLLQFSNSFLQCIDSLFLRAFEELQMRAPKGRFGAIQPFNLRKYLKCFYYSIVSPLKKYATLQHTVWNLSQLLKETLRPWPILWHVWIIFCFGVLIISILQSIELRYRPNFETAGYFGPIHLEIGLGTRLSVITRFRWARV